MRTTWNRILAPIAGFALAVVFAMWPAASAAEDGRPPVGGFKADLHPESFAGLHALIRPQAHEWRHLKVNWMTDVIPARRKAAAEDKPIVILYTGGAGYNEPLGVC